MPKYIPNEFVPKPVCTKQFITDIDVENNSI